MKRDQSAMCGVPATTGCNAANVCNDADHDELQCKLQCAGVSPVTSKDVSAMISSVSDDVPKCLSRFGNEVAFASL
jgi:hypothetical protein